MRFWFVILFFPFCFFPAWSLIDCWEGKSAKDLAFQSELVLVGHIKDIKPVGCRLGDGPIAACPKTLDLGPVPDRVLRIKFQVGKVLKGEAGNAVEFKVAVPYFILVQCKGPALELNMQTLAFLRHQGKDLFAWGGDYALYQPTRWDYGTVVHEVSEALQETQPQKSSQP